jgi:hypothetical protein
VFVFQTAAEKPQGKEVDIESISIPVDTYGDGQFLDSDGNRVNVGNCDAKGLNVNNNWDDNRYDNIGLSASRNFDSISIALIAASRRACGQFRR